MVVNIEIPVNTIKSLTTYTIPSDSKGEFPLLSIDVDSYIVQAKIETGINLDWDGGVHNIQIGKYSSIAEDVLFMIDVSHDYRGVAQGYISAIDEGEPPQKIKRKGQIIIENDCWIGHGATLMGGVTVHNGAVIAANATVTKDVPAYAIVGGNPAKIIGYRFSEEIVKKLLKIKWWDWTTEEIIERKNDIRGSVEAFANKYYEDNLLNRQNPVQRITDGKMFVYFLDINQPFAIYEKVLEQYMAAFDGKNCELVICMDSCDINHETNVRKMLGLLETYEDANCYINIYSGNLECATDILIGADYYITNRLPENLQRMCVAEELGVKCISGVDSDIFEHISVEGEDNE